MGCFLSKRRTMAIERARADAIPKPWGVMDLRPFRNVAPGDDAIGEIWYERNDAAEASSSLLLKLLFTSQPLSIQVHPDDAYAKAIGQRSGKTEAWYILSAEPGAKIAIGLKERLTSRQLREAIDDGSIADLVVWQAVLAGDSFLIPAGTIHAIGAGLVIAEIQQRSDATFRIFDYGRKRELHVEQAVEVAHAGPADFQGNQVRLSSERLQLIYNKLFALERIELAPNSTWRLETDRETWLLDVRGNAQIGLFAIAPGEAIFLLADGGDIVVGPIGLTALVSYTGGRPLPYLLTRIGAAGGCDHVLPPVADEAFTPAAKLKISTPHRSDFIQ
jgi:mannose-6-phosphate isomerase